MEKPRGEPLSAVASACPGGGWNHAAKSRCRISVPGARSTFLKLQETQRYYPHSTHIHISRQYMDCYLGEFSFPSNHRQMRNAMFDFLIAALHLRRRQCVELGAVDRTDATNFLSSDKSR